MKNCERERERERERDKKAIHVTIVLVQISKIKIVKIIFKIYYITKNLKMINIIIESDLKFCGLSHGRWSFNFYPST